MLAATAAPRRGGPYCFPENSQWPSRSCPTRPPPGWSTIRRLSFEQIADFCGLHFLEMQAIADDTAATKLTGRDPVRANELTHDEIEKGQKDPDYGCHAQGADPVRRTKGPRYTPVQAPGQAGTASDKNPVVSKSGANARPRSPCSLPVVRPVTCRKGVGSIVFVSSRRFVFFPVCCSTTEEPLSVSAGGRREHRP